MATTSTTTNAPSLDGRALFYMVLLALQFGIQPSLTRHFTPPKINRSTVILVQEVMKFGLAAIMLRLSLSSQQIHELYNKWSITQWISVAAIPAALYAVQNVAALTAYQHLDALTFNVLNQTKTLSAALCCYLIMGRQQSIIQVLSLLVLLLSALIMEGVVPLPLLGGGGNNEEEEATTTTISEDAAGATTGWGGTKHFTHGVAPILLASFISGLAGALSQKNLQSAGGGRNPYWFSMELCAASAMVLGIKLLINSFSQSEGTATTTTSAGNNNISMWDGWTLTTCIPIAVNAAGGIVVGLVTKYAGSVRKGFALIFGILLSGLVQEFVTNRDEGGGSVQPKQVVGGILAAISLYLHATNPPQRKAAAPSKAVDEAKKKD